MAPLTPSQDSVAFKAPDVRIARIVKTCTSSKWWLRLKPGFHYDGECANLNCESRGQAATGYVLCSRGMGIFRPSEDSDFDQIRCPACKTVCAATKFTFYQCSARVNFRIKGEKAQMFQLSQSAEGECLELGGDDKMATYTSLVIDCGAIGKYKELNMPTIFGSDASFSNTYIEELRGASDRGVTDLDS